MCSQGIPSYEAMMAALLPQAAVQNVATLPTTVPVMSKMQSIHCRRHLHVSAGLLYKAKPLGWQVEQNDDDGQNNHWVVLSLPPYSLRAGMVPTLCVVLATVVPSLAPSMSE
jgi:hypothetical protein